MIPASSSCLLAISVKSNRDVLDNTLNPSNAISVEHGYPLLKPSEVDCKMRDHMTPVLEAIPLKSLTSGDMKNLNKYICFKSQKGR